MVLVLAFFGLALGVMFFMSSRFKRAEGNAEVHNRIKALLKRKAHQIFDLLAAN